MSILTQNGTRMRKTCLGLLGLAVLAGCSSFAPTGTNKSTTVYKTVNDDGFIVISVPKPNDDAAKAVFVLRNKGDAEFADIEDTSPDGANDGEPCADVEGFCAAFKPDALPANVYLMDVFIDDEDQAKAAATIPFLVGGSAEADADATPTEDGEETEETEETEDGEEAEEEQ